MTNIADLIAAAPDLYEALNGVWSTWCAGQDSDGVFAELGSRIKDALAKVRGNSV